VTWRITDRATFESLRRSGRRARCGPVSVVYLRGQGRPRVGYAVSRRVGTAVERNRLKRRLRAVVGSIEKTGDLPDGSYLVNPGPAASQLDHPELLASVREAVRKSQLGPVRPNRSGE
jgi:ribonuclease P protein component